MLATARLACAAGRPIPPVRLYHTGDGKLAALLPIDPQPRWSVQIVCSKVGAPAGR